MLKAVIFDVDGVLVDSRNSNVAFFQKLLAKAGYPNITREQVLDCFHLPMRQTIAKLTGTDDEQEIQRIFKLGHDSSLRDSSLFEFHDRLEGILEELHEKYRLAIVTSRIRVGVDDIFSAKEIEHLFDVVVSFEDYKNPKPHPEPLELAIERLGVKADEAVYVGDSASDIEAAKAAGMKSIFFSLDSTNSDATHTVSKLDDIEKTLRAEMNDVTIGKGNLVGKGVHCQS
ncbi:MAG: HAD family hydrolase [Candidatus Saccharimonadales bacterium]